ncbi:protein LZIC-like isoform X1 [Homalodisca vitripennis]|uniref:protein LZIC-like isoform X1 n=2 Tax=Homalodisca vitripennis TaxID=197043 RepID=UPI001EECBDB8|nr:protein LZIC-like isoform X1 [Homalodisca vitripennis]
MTSKGQIETDKLKQNLEEQLERLVQQLADLEECKDDLEPIEYMESKADTMEQLEELNVKLKKHLAGDMTLVDQLSSMQLATQAAISKAFQTPAVIRMFARREPQQLRERLQAVERDLKLGKLSSNAADREKAEILSALRQLGEKLTPAELHFISDQTDNQTSLGKNFRFEQVTEDASVGERAVMDLATSDVLAAQKNS